jgi:WD40 repeat protein
VLLLAAPLPAFDAVTDPTRSLSLDGKVQARADGKAVALFDVNTNRELRRIIAHNDTVTAVAFSPDGKGLSSGDKAGVVCRTEAATGKVIWKHKSKSGVKALRYSKDGKTLTATLDDKTTREFDVATGKLK